MSFKFGSRSQRNLAQCHPDLQKIFLRVIPVFDCAVICGHRGQEEQDAAYHSGHSTLRFPQSKHNRVPSRAIDVVPYPCDWNDPRAFFYLAGIVTAVSKSLGIKIRWGGDWGDDHDFNNDRFMDLPHYELVDSFEK